MADHLDTVAVVTRAGRKCRARGGDVDPNEAPRVWDKKGNVPRVVFVFILLALTLFPLYYLVMTSLKTQGEALANPFLPPLTGLQFGNWLAVVEEVAQPALNSTIIAFGTVAGLLLIMTPCAYAFTWHRFPGKERLFTFAIITMMLPSILTFVPLYVLIRDLGLMDTKLAVILPAIAGSIGLSLFLLRAFFSALPNDLIEAARTDGATEIQILLRIVVPLSAPALITVAVLTVAGVWNQFLWPLVTLTTKTERVASVAATYFSGNPYFNSSIPLLMSAYVVSSVPLIVIMAVLLKYFMAGATQGALKG